MATTLNSDEERKRRIELVGRYIERTGDSYRKTAKFFSDRYFKISYVTVSQYLQEYIKLHPEKKPIIELKIAENKVNSIDDEEVYNRVVTAAYLFLQGNDVDFISKVLFVSPDTVYRDLRERIFQIDHQIGEKVEELLESHSLENLNHGNNTYEIQERDQKGRFSK